MMIRKAIPADAKGIAKVHVDSWRTTYKLIFPEDYLQSLSYESRENLWTSVIPNGYVYVAENHQGEIVGFSSGGKERTGDYPGYEGELYAIYLLHEYQGKGIGRQLMKPLIEQFTNDGIGSMTVLVLEENPSKHFYQSLGAIEIDQLQDTLAGKEVIELVYGWKDISKIV
ncbi:GNAT family N-acetyltransferase [Robertmurraya korlensis]|uniref:GNAT family N-acetyltransferase n=1 Tax=Robertmurraya korlensis TaxID=519977 RepID=UPI0020424BF6|nr:GNAT family N-acetyltransferase [Robertmurraya korlensis]MCM3601364.1 GNAT family N-acetyltransferase [Robertmurraya korlensis]